MGSFSESPLDFFFSGDLTGVLLVDAVGAGAGSRGLTFSQTFVSPVATLAEVIPTLDGVGTGFAFACGGPYLLR